MTMTDGNEIDSLRQSGCHNSLTRRGVCLVETLTVEVGKYYFASSGCGDGKYSIGMMGSDGSNGLIAIGGVDVI